MQSPITRILRQSLRKEGDKLNILTFPTHERYQEGLSRTGHNFYLWQGRNIKDWNRTFAELPSNHVLLNQNLGEAQLPIDVEIDLVLSQNKFGQFNIAKAIASAINVPLVSLEHTLPLPGRENDVATMRRMVGHKNVFISEYSRDCWGWNSDNAYVIHHGIDTDRFYPANKDRDKVILSVVNDWINRDVFCGFKIWQRVSNGLPVKVMGDTPGLSKPAANHSELLEAYQSSRIFLNTSTVSPVPTALMEAMACGCAVVSTATCMIPEIIKNGENGFISNNENHIRLYLEELMSNDKLATKVGKAARETILDRFPLHRFVEKWNDLFYTTASES